MIIMSLDNATKVCGVAIFAGDKLKYSGTIEANKNERNSMTRTEQIYRQIVAMAAEHKVDYIIFEDSFFSQNINTLKQLCRLQGCIMALCYAADIGFYLFMPTEWRSMLWQGVGKKREEQKKCAVDYVNTNYGMDLTYKEDDEAEAICLGEAFIKYVEQKGI